MKIQIVENTADYTFLKTCDCCPEQYEVFDQYGRRVGYVRYRYGRLMCQVPDVGGHVVFDQHIGGELDGCFENNEERQYYLELIAEAIQKYEEE